MNKKNRLSAHAAIIAILYIVLLLLFAPISFGAIQVRIAEILSVLPFFTPAAIPGLFVGCLIGNFMGGADILDTIFGSLTTLVAAGLAYKLRRNRYLLPIPPVVLNSLVVPLILRYAYKIPDSLPYMAMTTFTGQVISAYFLGLALLALLEKVGFHKIIGYEMPEEMEDYNDWIE